MHPTLTAAVAAAALGLLAATPASAGIVAADDHDLDVRFEAQLVQPPAQAYAAFAEVANWWDKAHTYSGDPANLSLSLAPGGCFCERLPGGGGVEHLRVALVRPGEEIVLTGALGPMLYEATAGVMQVQFAKVAGGTKVTLRYRASGFAGGGAAKLAPIVDMVLGQQMKRYRAYVASRRPSGPDPLEKR